jgi:hypothetical protein
MIAPLTIATPLQCFCKLWQPLANPRQAAAFARQFAKFSMPKGFDVEEIDAILETKGGDSHPQITQMYCHTPPSKETN